MEFTEEQNDDRAMDNMLNPEGKSCRNCQWGAAAYNNDELSDFITCGTHHQNFLITSMCAYWTSTDDPILIRNKAERKKKLLEKLKQ